MLNPSTINEAVDLPVVALEVTVIGKGVEGPGDVAFLEVTEIERQESICCPTVQ